MGFSPPQTGVLFFAMLMNLSARSLSCYLALWSLLLLLYTWGGHLYSPDCEVNYRTVRSLAEGAGYAIPPYPEDFGTRTGIDGKEYPQYGPLQPLLAVPLFWLGDRLSPLVPPEWLSFQADRMGRTVGFYRPLPGGAAGFQGLYPPDHRERVRRIFVSLFNPFVTWLSVLVLLVWGRRLFPDGWAWAALPMTYLLGTIAWPYSKPFYTEALATLLLLLAAWMAYEVKPLFRNDEEEPPPSIINLSIRFACVGLLTGLALLARLDSAVACPGLAVIAVGQLLASRPKRVLIAFPAAACAGILAFLSVTAIQLALNQAHYGSPFASGYSDQPEGIQFNIPVLSSLWIYLLSPGKGIFWYSPPLIAALLVWPAWARREKVLACGVILIVLGYLLVIGRWQNLGGWCWGPRHLVQLTPFLLLPIPLLLGRDSDGWHYPYGMKFFMITCLLGVIVQIMGVLVDFMWPLDQTLRGLAPGEDTARILSLPHFGPFLHIWSWKLDPDPDWFLCDLWRSGRMGARCLVGILCSFMPLSMLFLLKYKRLKTNEDSHANIGIKQ